MELCCISEYADFGDSNERFLEKIVLREYQINDRQTGEGVSF